MSFSGISFKSVSIHFLYVQVLSYRYWSSSKCNNIHCHSVKTWVPYFAVVPIFNYIYHLGLCCFSRFCYNVHIKSAFWFTDIYDYVLTQKFVFCFRVVFSRPSYLMTVSIHQFGTIINLDRWLRYSTIFWELQRSSRFQGHVSLWEYKSEVNQQAGLRIGPCDAPLP